MSAFKERQKLSWEGMFYSLQRIDLLIVSICGAGIYVSLETIKYFSDKELEPHFLIKISGGLFLFGIIVNFLSQIFGYKANEQDYLMCLSEVEAEEKGKKSKKLQVEIDNFDRKSEKFSKLTNYHNYISMGFMFLGLILIMIFFLFIF